MTGSLVSQYGVAPDWDATKRDYGGPITWSFQARLQESSFWLPFDENTFPDMVLDEDFSGQHQFDDWYGDPFEFATSELESALVSILSTLANVERVRISVWTTEVPPDDPLLVVQATDAQMEIGHLRSARESVARATRALEEARAQLRDQILRMHSQRLLGANKIAQEVGGGLSRRLVLELIAGREVIRNVQLILTGNSAPDYYVAPYSWPSRPLEQYSGPFRCGPLILTLDGNGTVSTEFNKDDDDRYDYDDDDVELWKKHQADQLAEAKEMAAVILPKLQSRGFALITADGSVASADDLAQTRIAHGGNLVVRRV